MPSRVLEVRKGKGSKAHGARSKVGKTPSRVFCKGKSGRGWVCASTGGSHFASRPKADQDGVRSQALRPVVVLLGQDGAGPTPEGTLRGIEPPAQWGSRPVLSCTCPRRQGGHSVGCLWFSPLVPPSESQWKPAWEGGFALREAHTHEQAG